MLRILFLLLLVAALIGGGLLLYSPEGRSLIDRATIAFTRAKNHWYHERGAPLPGTPDLAKLDARLAAQGLKARRADFPAHLQARFGARNLDGEGRTLPALRHLPDLPMVRAAWAEAERGRPAGA